MDSEMRSGGSILRELEYLVVGLGFLYIFIEQLLSIPCAWMSLAFIGAIPVMCWLHNLEASNASCVQSEYVRTSQCQGLWCSFLVPTCMYLNGNSKKYDVSDIMKLNCVSSIPLFASTLLWVMDPAKLQNKYVMMSPKYRLVILANIIIVLIYSSTANYFIAFLDAFMFCLLLHGAYFITVQNLLTKSPKSFTLGEAVIVAHSVPLISTSAYMAFKKHIFYFFVARTETDDIVGVLLVSLVGCVFFIIMCLYIKKIRSPFLIFATLVCINVGFTLPTIWYFLGQNPILWMLNFMTLRPLRVLLICYWGLLVVFAVFLAFVQQKRGHANTVIRKYFHILIVMTFVPGIIYELNMLFLFSGLVMEALVIIECFRILRIPPIGEYINNALSAFRNDKDQGLLITAHMSLLIGCSAPIWLLPEFKIGAPLVIFSGILSVGIGDTCASVAGTWFGNHKWPESKKSVEGTVSSAVVQILFYLILEYAGCETVPFQRLILVTSLSSLLEAFTDQIDNLILPLYLYFLTLAM